MKKVLIIITLIALFFLVQFLANKFKTPGRMGIIESQTMDMAVTPPKGPLFVQTEIAKLTPFGKAVSYTGSVVAYNEIPIYPRVEGLIQYMDLYPGDRVSKGQLLAKLDSVELSARVNETQYAAQSSKYAYQASLSSIQEAQAANSKSEAAIKSAQADFKFWQNQFNRSKQLVNEGVISIEEFQSDQAGFEESRSSYNQALADYRATRSAVKSAQSQARAAESQVKEAEQVAKTQNIVKSYTNIASPIDGIVTERTMPPGTLVSTGMQILKVAQLSPIRIQANVTITDFNKVKPGNRVLILPLDKENASAVEAKVTTVFPSVNTQTRTGIVEALYPNKDLRFLPGDFIRMKIYTGDMKESVTIPVSAVINRNQQDAVWVIKNKKATLKYITAGDSDSNRIEVLSGLNPGEEVIINNIAQIQDGMLVTSSKPGENIVVATSETASNRLTAENNYEITQAYGHYSINLELTKKPPFLGDNPYRLSITSPHGAEVNNFVLKIRNYMPAMPTMYIPEPSIKKKKAGSFEGTINLSMPGLWEVEVTVKQGQEPPIVLKYELEVSE